MVAAMRLTASSTRGAAVEVFEVLGQRSQGGLARPPGVEQRGTARRHAHGVAAELLDLEAEPLQIGGVRKQASACRSADTSTSIGSSSRWLSSARCVSRSVMRSKEHAFVRHVLVDDRDAVFVDGDDERVAKLPQRHQRTHRGCAPPDCGAGTGGSARSAGTQPASPSSSCTNPTPPARSGGRRRPSAGKHRRVAVRQRQRGRPRTAAAGGCEPTVRGHGRVAQRVADRPPHDSGARRTDRESAPRPWSDGRSRPPRRAASR